MVGLHLQHAFRAHADGSVVDEAHMHMAVGGGLEPVADQDGGAAAQGLAAAVGTHDAGLADQQADLADGGLGGAGRSRQGQAHRNDQRAGQA